MEMKDHPCNQRDQSVKEKTNGRDANRQNKQQKQNIQATDMGQHITCRSNVNGGRDIRTMECLFCCVLLKDKGLWGTSGCLS